MIGVGGKRRAGMTEISDQIIDFCILACIAGSVGELWYHSRRVVCYRVFASSASSASFFRSFMGIQLPIMDGYEVTRKIKADPALRSIPIIAVTSHALDGEEQTARAAGCDGYVPEPYSPRQLLAKIQHCMAQ